MINSKDYVIKYSVIKKSHLRQNIHERTKYNLQNTAFKKIEEIWSVKTEHITTNFYKSVFQKFYLVYS